MKLENAIRLTIAVAMAYGSYVNNADASCLINQTMTLDNCPIGSGPSDPGGDPIGDPPNTDPNRLFYGMVPSAPDNPYYVTCASSDDEKNRFASYALRYFIAYETAKLGWDPNFPRNTLFEILLSDGKYLLFMDTDSVRNGAPLVTGVNMEINGPSNVCYVPTGPWMQLGDTFYMYS